MSAIQEYQRTHRGRFVNYKTLPNFVWETLLPRDYGIPVDATMIERMQALSHTYSKARNKADPSFSEDATSKRQQASPEVRMAADLLAQDVYAQLETLSQQQLEQQQQQQAPEGHQR